MRGVDGIHKMVRNPVVRAHARRFSIGLALLVMMLGLAINAGTPKQSLGETGAVSSNRIFSDGFETQTINDGAAWSNPGGSSMSINTSTAHGGLASAECNVSGTNCFELKTFASSAQTGKFWFRMYFYIKTAGTNASNPITCLYDTSATPRVCITINPSRVLAIANATGGSPAGGGTGTTALSLNTWYRIELAVDDTTTSSTTASLRLNGVNEITASTMNILGGFEQLSMGNRNNDTVDWLYDDIAINNDNGRSDNWPGDGKIVNILPGSAGDNTNWTQSGTCTGGNYACVNDLPLNTTNYVTTSSAITDDYALDSYANYGIGANDLIRFVSVNNYTRSALPVTSGSMVVNYRLKATSGGTTTTSSNITYQSLNSWRVGDPTSNLELAPITSYSLPGTNTPWTASNLSTAQIGVTYVSGSKAANVTALWLLVEYSPASGGRLWSSGFESGSATNGVEWDSFTGSPTIETATPHGGSYYMQTASGGAQSYASYQFLSTDGNGPYYVRTYLRIATLPSVNGVSILQLRSTFGTRRLWLNMSSAGALSLFSDSGGNAQIGSSSNPLNTNVWYRIEVQFDRTPSSGSQVASARINGVSFASSSTLTLGNAVDILLLGDNIQNTAATAGQLLFDDVAINQNAGSVQNSWPGSGYITYLRPNAAGDNSGWTKNGAGCTGGSNYQCVSEVTPDDATTYVSATTTNTIDDYNITDPGFSSSSTINLVQVGVRLSTASSTEEDFRVRIKDSSGGVPIESQNITPASTTWTTNASATPFNYSMTAYTRPTISTSWTTTSLTSSQIGIRDYGSTTGTAQVSAVWLLVDYTPPTFSISGTVYSTDETTAVTSQPTVAVEVSSGNYYSTTAASNGTFTVSSISITSGTGFVIYLDTGGGITGATYSVFAGSNLSGINIYQDRLTTRCDNSCSLTNSNIASNDKNSDSDIHATVSAGNLTVDNDWKLLVVANTFAPGGTVTTSAGGSNSYSGNVEIKSGATLNMAGNNLTVGGSFANGGTYTSGSNTTEFDGSTQQTISKTSGANTFYNLTISNASGTADPGCGTSFTPGVIFANDATATNNYVVTTANALIQYHTGSTYTFTNINWNGQASGTKIQFRNSSLSSGTWLLNVSGTQTAVSYVNVGRSDASGGSTILANDGTNTDCNNNTNWNFGAANHAPDSPTSLTQKRYTAGTTMSVGDWTNEAKATFTVSATDTDNPDTLYLCVEVIPIASTFTNTETGCGTGVAYSGTAVTLTYSNTTLTDQTEYKWQARVKDAASAYSAWVDYGSNGASRDFGIDTTAPTTGTVNDGTGSDTDYNNGSLTSLSANWTGFDSTISGLSEYDYSIGTTVGGTDIVTWTNNGTSTSVTATGLDLRTNILYYTNVRASDNAGNTSNVVSSNGQWVLPELTFGLGSNSLSFANLNSTNNYQDSQSTTITTSTNAYGGYVVTAYAGSLLSAGTTTIPMFSAGTYGSPAAWGSSVCSGSSCGFGYTSSDATIGGVNKFGSGTLYAPFSLTAPGDIVADHTTAVDGSSGAVSNESYTITCKIAVSQLQPALTYTGAVYYIATGTF